MQGPQVLLLPHFVAANEPLLRSFLRSLLAGRLAAGRDAPAICIQQGASCREGVMEAGRCLSVWIIAVRKYAAGGVTASR